MTFLKPKINYILPVENCEELKLVKIYPIEGERLNVKVCDYLSTLESEINIGKNLDQQLDEDKDSLICGRFKRKKRRKKDSWSRSLGIKMRKKNGTSGVTNGDILRTTSGVKNAETKSMSGLIPEPLSYTEEISKERIPSQTGLPRNLDDHTVSGSNTSISFERSCGVIFEKNDEELLKEKHMSKLNLVKVSINEFDIKYLENDQNIPLKLWNGEKINSSELARESKILTESFEVPSLKNIQELTFDRLETSKSRRKYPKREMIQDALHTLNSIDDTHCFQSEIQMNNNMEKMNFIEKVPKSERAVEVSDLFCTKYPSDELLCVPPPNWVCDVCCRSFRTKHTFVLHTKTIGHRIRLEKIRNEIKDETEFNPMDVESILANNGNRYDVLDNTNHGNITRVSHYLEREVSDVEMKGVNNSGNTVLCFKPNEFIVDESIRDYNFEKNENGRVQNATILHGPNGNEQESLNFNVRCDLLPAVLQSEFRADMNVSDDADLLHSSQNNGNKLHPDDFNKSQLVIPNGSSYCKQKSPKRKRLQKKRENASIYPTCENGKEFSNISSAAESILVTTALVTDSERQVRQICFKCYICNGHFSSLLHLGEHIVRHANVKVTNGPISGGPGVRTKVNCRKKRGSPLASPIKGNKIVECSSSRDKSPNEIEVGAVRNQRLVNSTKEIGETYIGENESHSPRKTDEGDRVVRNGGEINRLSEKPLKVNGAKGVKDAIKKEYQCRVCLKSFGRSFSLHRHERIHTGYKPAYCLICRQGFSETRNLRHHQMRYHANSEVRERLRQQMRRRCALYRQEKKRNCNFSSFLKKTAVLILNTLVSNNKYPVVQDSDESALVVTDRDSRGVTSKKEKATPLKGDRHEPKDAGYEYETFERTNICEQMRLAQNFPVFPKLTSRESVKSTLSSSLPPAMAPEEGRKDGCSEIAEDFSGCIKAKKSLTFEPGAVNTDFLSSDIIASGGTGSTEIKILEDGNCQILVSSTGHLCGIKGGSGGGVPPKNSSIPVFRREAQLAEDSEIQIKSEFTDEISGDSKLFNSVCLLDLDLGAGNKSAILRKNTRVKEEDMTSDTTNQNVYHFRTPRNSALFSSYNPRLGIVQVPLTRKDHCKPFNGPNGKVAYPCTYCEKLFCTSSELNRHLDFHEDIRPFQCSFCKYRSRTHSQLKVHLMRHKGIKQYTCHTCNYNGVTQSELRRHLQTKTHIERLQNVCKDCGLGFYSEACLYGHRQLFHTNNLRD